MRKHFRVLGSSVLCPGLAPSEHGPSVLSKGASIPTLFHSLVTSGSPVLDDTVSFPRQSPSHTPAPTDILSWPPEAVA